MKRIAQGSLEYVFMVAMGLLIIAIIINYLFGVKGAARDASQHINATKRDINNSLRELNSTN